LAEIRGSIAPETAKDHIAQLLHLPVQIEQILGMDPLIEEVAKEYYRASDFLFLGRGVNYPIALEGALKLKEISYIHAEGYPAGEMKHGPIALIDRNIPVVAIALRDRVYEKMLSNIQEARAREGQVIAIATEGDTAIAAKADHVIAVPETEPRLAPILATLPLQPLASSIPVLR